MEQQRRYTAKYNAQRRAMHNSAFSIIKLEAGCADCGFNEFPEALDFDHQRDKLFGISAKLHYPIEVLLAEAEKCEVVCANCHRLRTVTRCE